MAEALSWLSNCSLERAMTLDASTVIRRFPALSLLAIVILLGRAALAFAGQGAAPGAPSNLQASVAGFQVTLSWQPPSAGPNVTGYLLEAGSRPGLADIGQLPFAANTLGFSAAVPTGTYFVRVRAKSGGLVGPVSNEVVISIPSGCSALGAPSNFDVKVVGSAVSLSWSPVPGATSYILEAGSAPGASNLATVDLRSTVPFLAVSAPDGEYHVRMRARNACGLGPASQEAMIAVGACAGLSAPTGLTAAVDGSTVTVRWNALPLPLLGYVLEVGTTPGGTQLGQLEVGAATSVTAAAPDGTYYLRVRGRRTCALGPASNEIVAKVGDPSAGPLWLRQVNRWRQLAGVPPVVENPEWSHGDVLHSRYSVKENILEHNERATSPWFTEAGRDAAFASNGSGNGSATAPDAYAIESWVQAPFHALGMFEPLLDRVGYGSYREVDGGLQMSGWLDIIRGMRFSLFPTDNVPYFFPADGAVVPIPNAELCPAGTACFWGEYPSPLTSCPGYQGRAGLPLFVRFSSGPIPQVTASSLTRDGVPLAHCTMTGATYANPSPVEQTLGRDILTARRAIVLVPKAPLPANSTYVASVVVDGQTYTWSFSIAPAQASDGPPPPWVFGAIPPSFSAPKPER